MVEHRRAMDPGVDDRFRGLYISEDDVDRLLAAPAAGPRVAPSPQARRSDSEPAPLGRGAGRLDPLAAAFGLDALDTELLVVALAPDLDPRFERLYAYLNDDVSRRRATTGLALELCGAAPFAAVERRRLSLSSHLVGGGLLLVEEPDRPFLTRSLRVPDRITAHLLGDDTPDPQVATLLAGCDHAADHATEASTLRRALGAGVRLCYLRERLGAGALSTAFAALDALGLPGMAIDLGRLAPGEDPAEVLRAAVRDARLRRACLVAGPVEVLAERGPGTVRVLAEARCAVVLFGGRQWDPLWSSEAPLLLDSEPTADLQRRRLWQAALEANGQQACDPLPTHLRLTPEQVSRATTAALRHALAAGRALRPEDLTAGARAQNAAGLESLARRITPAAGWDDLVLTADVRAQLHELTARTRNRDRVLGEWGLGRSPSRGRGVTALFAGDSGTGKTLSAEVVAGALGLDLYVVDLATVVDKYIGETEKNLDRIFAEADRVNGLLLFDEADALFGKRSEVKDAHDRHANIEVAYLLQRMERFEGLAILASNLRANLDEAFIRRLDAIVDFPMPEEADRMGLWCKHLGPGVPRADDLDLAFLARSFRLSGGNIRNICVSAAFRAADADRAVDMADLIRATAREYRKMGRLCVEAEFGRYSSLLAAG